MTVIDTIRGKLPLDELVVTDHVEWAPQGRLVSTSYVAADGELVRKDVWYCLYEALATETLTDG